MEQNSIVVKNVTKKFDDFMLDHISFTVNFRPVEVGCG